MDFNIEQLKKKIIYRSNYRGTKEMDKLLGKFTNEHIDMLEIKDLVMICNSLLQRNNFNRLENSSSKKKQTYHNFTHILRKIFIRCLLNLFQQS